MKNIIAVAMLSTGAVFGDIVSFVPGGDAGHPAELTASANWSPNPPTENDVVEIDSGSLGFAKLTLAADLSAAGLRVKNSTQLLTIAPAEGARLAFGWNDAPGAFGAIRATGIVTIDVSDLPAEHQTKKVLFTYDSLDADGATFVLTGANVDSVYDRVTFNNGCCCFRAMRGLNMIVR